MFPGLGAQVGLAIVQRQGAALQDRFEARRDMQADAARFRERAAAIPDVDALLRDRRSLTVVLEAFQLEGEVDKRALLRRILTEPPTEQRSLANRLTDPRWRQLAAAFGGRAGPPLGDARLVDSLLDRAMTNRFEKAMGEGNPGLREALYFRRNAGTVTRVTELMADRALMEVARGALGLPTSFALLGFEQQRDLLTRRLDMAQFQDPKAVQRMVQRYLATNAGAAAPAGGAAALFSAPGASALPGLVGRSLSLRA